MITVPGHGKFRVQFRSRGLERGSRILEILSLQDIPGRWKGPWTMDPRMIGILENQAYGWNQRQLESQAQWFGDTVGQAPEAKKKKTYLPRPKQKEQGQQPPPSPDERPET